MGGQDVWGVYPTSRPNNELTGSSARAVPAALFPVSPPPTSPCPWPTLSPSSWYSEHILPLCLPPASRGAPLAPPLRALADQAGRAPSKASRVDPPLERLPMPRRMRPWRSCRCTSCHSRRVPRRVPRASGRSQTEGPLAAPGCTAPATGRERVKQQLRGRSGPAGAPAASPGGCPGGCPGPGEGARRRGPGCPWVHRLCRRKGTRAELEGVRSCQCTSCRHKNSPGTQGQGAPWGLLYTECVL